MRRLHVMALLAAAAMTSGCAYDRITERRQLHGDHPEHVRATALMGTDPNLAVVCDGHPPAEHRARATALDTAAAVLSFGMIVPVTVEYSCAHGEAHVPPPTAAVLTDVPDASRLAAEHRPPPPAPDPPHASDHEPPAASATPH